LRAPSTPVERTLADIWRELLPGGGARGVDDDFLTLRGDSIVSVQVSARPPARLAGLAARRVRAPDDRRA
jgi:hypothetical protein